MPVNLGNRVLPALLVSDMRRTLDFYTEVLGFYQTGYYPIESDPVRTEVRRDSVAIIFYSESIHGLGERPAMSGLLYVFPESVEKLAAEYRGKVPCLWGPEETEFGVREFAIRDPNGYVLAFAEPVKESK
jgi:catechol 2,3-dioxygenase-like lactoylglutathione lyase family enzyme